MKRLLMLFACAQAVLSLALASSATEITEIRPDSSPVPLYGKFEVGFDLSTTYVNPFNPAEVDASLRVLLPSGGPLVIPAFWHQDYERSKSATDENLTPIGDPCWVARFAPTESGVHTYYIEVTDSEGYVRSDDASFTCELSADRGYVRPDPSDSRLFTFDDGSYYLPVGENVCWASNLGTYDYDVYFSEMEASGQNWTRIWMTHFFRGQTLEWTPNWTGYFHGLGVYSLECAWKLDYMVELARQKGIYIQLVTQHHGQFSTSNYPNWDENPYNTANGGMLSSPELFFTNADAKDLYKRKARYTIARWGYATSILCWEFWNEVGYTDNYNSATVASWHGEMAQYIESIDPWDHMLTTSVSAHPTSQLNDPVWSLPEIDCTQLHLYISEITNTIRDKTVSMWTHGKPVIVGEFGCWPLNDRFGDTDGTHIHNAIWSAAMTMSGAMTWWWDDYIHPYDLYYHYAGLSSYFQGEDLRDPALDILDLVVDGARGYGIGASNCAYVWVQDPDHTLGGVPGGTLSGVTLEIPDMTTGFYDIEYWNTFLGSTTGTEVITCTDGTLRLDIPDFDLDLALKARRQDVGPLIGVTLDAPVSPWTCYNTAPTVDISASDEYGLDCVKYQIGTGSWAVIECGLSGTNYTNNDWPLPYFGDLDEGSNTYNFKSTDDAGNESDVASVTFTKDTIDPSAVTDFTSTVKHNQIVLDWTNPGSDVDRIYLYRNDWTSYPTYGTADPGYPTVGGSDLQTDVGAVETYKDASFSNTTRGIYAYRAVVYDCAGNYAAAGSGDYDRSTSYFLGDIASVSGSWGPNYDGLVSGFDYNPFSGCYWSSPPPGSCIEADFGPTVEPARGRFGIPVPEGYVGFEDLMIFSMNYGNVPPPPAPPGPPMLGVELASVGFAEDAGSYRLSLREVSQADGLVELALVVEGNEMFKGLSAEIEYDHSGLEFVSVLPSAALLGGSRVLFMGDEVDGVLRIDFAAMGGGVVIGGNGPVATLSFRRSGESGSSVRITSADARDVDNNVLLLELEEEVRVEPGMPLMFALRGNSPNPFAGSTAILYDVPRDASVSLRIYNIQGQVVRTLVDGMVSAGRHSETWDGSDGGGHSLPSGVYFVKMSAGSYDHMTKTLKLN